MLALVGGLFLIIQFVALVIGLLLARQITGAVHDLFTGTQHLRNRDFVHSIPVRARDQLGELAESFNVMTGEVHDAARRGGGEGPHGAGDARGPRHPAEAAAAGAAQHPGPVAAAFCEPAREVAGDYYDFLPITDTMIGVLIADVAGKGLAAGLYMAQLKVIVQSLARLHHEPREFLIAVNTVVAQNLDAKSFITMTYARDRPRATEMTFARAGHCPLIHVPGVRAGRPAQGRDADAGRPGRRARPSTMARCSRVDSRGAHRDARPSGDLVVLFTDGISETMNEAFDCFGEARLSQGDRAVRAPAVRPAALLHPRRAAGLRRRSADQHDDMTMILMRVAMNALTVVFRTRSEIEANVVQGAAREPRRAVGPHRGRPAGHVSRSPSARSARRVVSVREEEGRGRGAHHRGAPRPGGGGLVVPLPQQFDALEARLGYHFRDRGLLEHALTHKSKAHEDPSGGVVDNESLEFLGDAVLGLVIGRRAVTAPSRPTPKGRSRRSRRTSCPRRRSRRSPMRLGLGDHMILGRGEEKTGGRRKPALLADTCEAIIAALYLDGGLDAARGFIIREIGLADRGGAAAQLLRPRLQVAAAGAAAEPGPLAAGTIACWSETGPEHRKVFAVQVVAGDEMLAEGQGRTKKDAEQEAARLAMEGLEIGNPASHRDEIGSADGALPSRPQSISMMPTARRSPETRTALVASTSGSRAAA